MCGCGRYVAAVGALVFVLLFCEFGLVRLTSSLSLAVFGVMKELLTIVLAATQRGGSPPCNARLGARATGPCTHPTRRARTDRASRLARVSRVFVQTTSRR